MSVGGSISIQVSASESKSGVTVGNALWNGNVAQTLTFGNGTTANNFDLVYVAERTVASGANDDIDLAGVLSSALGTSIAAAKLVALTIVNEQADETQNTTNLTIGGGTNTVPGFANAGPAIGPGGIYSIVSPSLAGLATVTAGTGDIIRVANSAGAQNKYKISIFARSA